MKVPLKMQTTIIIVFFTIKCFQATRISGFKSKVNLLEYSSCFSHEPVAAWLLQTMRHQKDILG